MMQHKQHPNAVAYIIYEKATIWLKEEGPDAPWRKALMFYAEDHVFTRDEMWDRNVAWRDPENIRVAPLFDDDAMDTLRENQLDAVNARYEADTKTVSLASAVVTALEQNQPDIESFEGLVKALSAFDSRIQTPLTEI